MPRERRREPEDIPAEVAAYDPLVHGPGDDGVRRWEHAALGWLRVNRTRGLPGIGDELAVFREALRLMGAYEPPRHTWTHADGAYGL